MERFSRASYFMVALALFFFVYGPPLRLLPVNVSTLVGVIAWGFILRDPQLLAHIRTIKLELMLLCLIIMYSVVLSMRGGDVGLMFAPVTILLFNIPFCVWISTIIVRMGHAEGVVPSRKLFGMLISIGIISAVLSVLLALSPEAGEFVKFQVMKYDDVLMEFQSHRAFGLADELLFSFSLVQGVIAIYLLRVYGIHVWSLVAVLLLLASCALNARIGLLMIVVIPFAVRWSAARLLVVAVLLAGLGTFFSVSEHPTVVLIAEQSSYLVRELGEALSGDIGGTVFEALLNDMFFLPSEGWELLFGSGENLFLDNSKNSDSGYVIMLGYGGLIYLTLVLLFVFACVVRKTSRRQNSFYMWVLAGTFLVANVKGLFFAAKPGMHLFLLVHIFFVIEARLTWLKAHQPPAVAGTFSRVL
ncbi:hypothetical protein [Massilia sp. GCM10023247]|uniref:hypothetical protein n=1 Tax=Massilia sp. GCM10023247 TaxID=3252643 RepID=UPI00360D847F